jgi:hypothetical protein
MDESVDDPETKLGWRLELAHSQNVRRRIELADAGMQWPEVLEFVSPDQSMK